VAAAGGGDHGEDKPAVDIERSGGFCLSDGTCVIREKTSVRVALLYRHRKGGEASEGDVM
jgi:hypothetical protein